MKQAALLIALTAIVHLGFSQSIFVSNSPLSQHPIRMPEMQQMLDDVISVVGLQPDFQLREAKVLNIEATISHKKRYISYNPQFISQISALTNDRWAILTLLAHEVAHHLDGHTINKNGSRPELELQADEFAGFVLRKLGATLQQSQEVIKYIASPTGSATHPPRESRMLAIQTGWTRGGGSPEAATVRISENPSGKGASN
jgi:hypothetical protein